MSRKTYLSPSEILSCVRTTANICWSWCFLLTARIHSKTYPWIIHFAILQWSSYAEQDSQMLNVFLTQRLARLWIIITLRPKAWVFSGAWEYLYSVNFHFAFDIQFIFPLICAINIRGKKFIAHKSFTGSLPHNLCALGIFIICYFNWCLNRLESKLKLNFSRNATFLPFLYVAQRKFPRRSVARMWRLFSKQVVEQRRETCGCSFFFAGKLDEGKSWNIKSVIN